MVSNWVDIYFDSEVYAEIAALLNLALKYLLMYFVCCWGLAAYAPTQIGYREYSNHYFSP